MKKLFYNLILGDCSTMKELESDSIHLIVTSPPYYNVKEYSKGLEGDIGNLDNYKEYLDAMRKVFKECFRVIQYGRIIAVNVSDVVSDDIKYPIQADYHNILRDIGFRYKENIIWQKPKGILSAKRFGVTKQNPYPMYYKPNNIYENILIYMKGKYLQQKRIPKDYEKDEFSKEFMEGIETDVWYFPTASAVDEGHAAPFPITLPDYIIKLYSFTGENVLDPFLGTGTTMLAAKESSRSCVGYEINEDYIDLIKRKVGWKQQSLSGEVEYSVLKRCLM